MNKNLLIGAGVFLVVVVAGSFLITKPAKNTPEPSAANVGPSVSGTETAGPAEGAREVGVSGSEYSYNPSNLSFTKGERIRLTFTNNGTLPHDLVIDELGVSTKTIVPGKSDTVEFTADQSGTFNFYCNIGNHRSLGMEGSVEVK